MTTIIAKNNNFARLDSVISEVLGISRAKSARFIKSSNVWVNGNLILKPSVQISQGDRIEVKINLDEKNDTYCLDTQYLDELILVKPELKQISILYEDSNILIINKPPNLVIHQAPSLKEPTLQDWLKYKAKDFGISLNEDLRFGIAHRLDRETSGALSIAKNFDTLTSLSSQLKSRQMGRIYLAIIEPPLKNAQILECFLGRNPKNRLKMTKIGKSTQHIISQDSIQSFVKSTQNTNIIESSSKGFIHLLNAVQQCNTTNPTKSIDGHNLHTDSVRYAKSAFLPLLHSHSHSMQLIAVKLFTGRTHQIRAQLESLGRHIIGDSLYGFKPHTKAGKECNKFLQNTLFKHRIFLHAYLLYLCRPNDESGKMSLFKAQILGDMVEFLQTFFDLDGVNEALDIEYILRCFRAF